MLDLITKSKVRKKIILLLMNNKGREYYINQIAKIVKTSAGTTQRELNRLLGNGMVTHRRVGNLVLFKLNESNTLMGAIESIVNQTIGIQEILKTEMKRLDKLEYAFIFGSYAKGGFNTESDVDVYAVGDFEEENIYKMIRKIEGLIYRDINLHTSSLDEFKQKLKDSYFIKEIVKDRLMIVGDEDGFAKIVKGIRIPRQNKRTGNR